MNVAEEPRQDSLLLISENEEIPSDLPISENVEIENMTVDEITEQFNNIVQH